LPIFEFENISEPISFINDKDKPLALYYYGSCFSNNIDRLIKETSSGILILIYC